MAPESDCRNGPLRIPYPRPVVARFEAKVHRFLYWVSLPNRAPLLVLVCPSWHMEMR